MPRWPKLTLQERFEKFIEPVSESGCWIWTGCVDGCGYGMFRVENKTVKPHRISFEFYKGPIPQGMNVLHHCDTPTCINPHHLFLGTQKDNMSDCFKKGRGFTPRFFGESNGSSKLNSEDILKILKDERSEIKIAKDFKVSRQQINRIKNKTCWNHIKEPFGEKERRKGSD